MKNPAPHIASFIFLSRWLQAPLYLGLIVAQGVYVIKFGEELWHLVHDLDTLSHTDILLMVLGLIDVVMIANLLIMVILGGYEIFVSKLRIDEHPDQPDWLHHVDAGMLKVKLAMSLIGISSIHLLRSFIDAGNLTEHQLKWEVIIHCVLVGSAVFLAVTDRIMMSIPAAKPGHGSSH
ncbi:MAG: TIGR00645 family protein [Pseudomonadota bacterium]